MLALPETKALKIQKLAKFVPVNKCDIKVVVLSQFTKK